MSLMKKNTNVRVRYAPSPTGFQHIGGIRTAIVNFLLSRSLKGDFIVRIEDTDRDRYVEGAEEYILETLRWLGINYKEGPDKGGEYGPYRQSERLEIYSRYVKDLIDSGNAYYAFDSSEELESERKKARENGSEFLYNYLTRHRLRNSLVFSPEEVERKLQEGQYTIRLKLPENVEIDFPDVIRGNLSVHTKTLEDKILLKSSGWPTYHLASIVDDTLMKITHVIRGEEWLPSAPIHHFLYKAFGWESSKPQFAHLPLILNPDGNGKLSKRKLMDSDTPIFPLSWKNKNGKVVKGLREEGFLPNAVLNFLILLGWNDKTGKEIFSREELFDKFDFNLIQKSGAVYDFKKALWINSKHIQETENEKLLAAIKDLGDSRLQNLDSDRLEKSVPFFKKRLETLTDIFSYSYLFDSLYSPDGDIQLSNVELDILTKLNDSLSKQINWNTQELGKLLSEIRANSKLKPKVFFQLMRTVMVGKTNGPDVSEILSILGKEETIRRISLILNARTD